MRSWGVLTQSARPTRPVDPNLRKAMRISPWLTGIALLATAHALPVPAHANWQQTEFYVGALGEPLLDAGSYRQAAAAGFNLIVPGPWSTGSIETDLLRLDLAAETGMKVLLSRGQSEDCSNPCPPNETCAALQPLWDLTAMQKGALAGYWLPEEPTLTPANGDCASDWAQAMHQDDQLRDDGHDRAVLLNFSFVAEPGGEWFDQVNAYVNPHPANAQLDVATINIYPWRITCPGIEGRCWGVPEYFQRLRELRIVMGSRPFWIVSYLACASPCGGFFASTPDSSQLRFEAFAPAAAGAKGLLWYRYLGDFFQVHNGAVRNGVIVTNQARWLTSINMYLRTVVGPVAMTATHRGLFFQSPQTWDAGGLGVVNSNPAVCPVNNLNNSNLAVGVFQPDPEVDEFYLLITNLSLAPTSSTVELHHSYAIARASSAIGYVGGNAYAEVGNGSSFTVSLAGGEGRMYRVSPTTGELFQMVTGPGDSWMRGTQKTISWQGNGGPVGAYIFPEVGNLEVNEPPALPITLATGLTGTSATLTMPIGVRSRRAQLVLTSIGLSNNLMISTTHTGIRTTALSLTPRTYYPIAGARGFLSGKLRLDATGQPSIMRVERTQSPPIEEHFIPRLYESQLIDGLWVDEELIIYESPPGLYPTAAVLDHCVDSHGRAHLVYGLQGDFSLGADLQHVVRVEMAPDWVFWVDRDAGISVQDVRQGWLLEPMPGTSGDVMFAHVEGGGATAYPRVTLVHTEDANHTVSGTTLPSPTQATRPKVMAAAVDASGVVWLACVCEDPAPGSLRVFRITSSTCTEVLYQDVGQYRLIDITVDPQGRPAITYTLASNAFSPEQVRYQRYDGANWDAAQLVDGGPNRIGSLAIADAAGSPRIAYIANGLTTIASPLVSGWDLDPLGATHQAEGPISLECSPEGDLWVSFRVLDADQIVVYGPGESGGDPPCNPCDPSCDPCPILPAIEPSFENPLIEGGELTFALKSPEGRRLEMPLFDVAGRRVARFGPQSIGAGTARVTWSLKGIGVGVYFLRAQLAGAPELRQKVVIIP